MWNTQDDDHQKILAWSASERRMKQKSLKRMIASSQSSQRNLAQAVIESSNETLAKYDIASCHSIVDNSNSVLKVTAFSEDDLAKPLELEFEIQKPKTKQPLNALHELTIPHSTSVGKALNEIMPKMKDASNLRMLSSSKGEVTLSQKPVRSIQTHRISSILTVGTNKKFIVTNTSIIGPSGEYLAQNVVFKPQQAGTRVFLTCAYTVPSGTAGTITRLFSNNLDDVTMLSADSMNDQGPEGWRKAGLRSVLMTYAALRSIKRQQTEQNEDLKRLLSTLKGDIDLWQGSNYIKVNCPNLKMVVCKSNNSSKMPLCAILMQNHTSKKDTLEPYVHTNCLKMVAPSLQDKDGKLDMSKIQKAVNTFANEFTKIEKFKEEFEEYKGNHEKEHEQLEQQLHHTEKKVEANRSALNLLGADKDDPFKYNDNDGTAEWSSESQTTDSMMQSPAFRNTVKQNYIDLAIEKLMRKKSP